MDGNCAVGAPGAVGRLIPIGSGNCPPASGNNVGASPIPGI